MGANCLRVCLCQAGAHGRLCAGFVETSSFQASCEEIAATSNGQAQAQRTWVQRPSVLLSGLSIIKHLAAVPLHSQSCSSISTQASRSFFPLQRAPDGCSRFVAEGTGLVCLSCLSASTRAREIHECTYGGTFHPCQIAAEFSGMLHTDDIMHSSLGTS